ncbi:hypothetical protein DFH08DRAFT_40075 [Mycena albidolilacea]|uniref:Uncharacterized protein n=1 Tax=Mycena albidolilacea TaxID=1033008 RepID=A0AAD7ABU4_9AGAR|nr:hypothetical protein DFH08DRAFT_40075 [Mycena albidolilacea]
MLLIHHSLFPPLVRPPSDLLDPPADAYLYPSLHIRPIHPSFPLSSLQSHSFHWKSLIYTGPTLSSFCLKSRFAVLQCASQMAAVPRRFRLLLPFAALPRFQRCLAPLVIPSQGALLCACGPLGALLRSLSALLFPSHSRAPSLPAPPCAPLSTLQEAASVPGALLRPRQRRRSRSCSHGSPLPVRLAIIHVSCSKPPRAWRPSCASTTLLAAHRPHCFYPALPSPIFFCLV